MTYVSFWYRSPTAAYRWPARYKHRPTLVGWVSKLSRCAVAFLSKCTNNRCKQTQISYFCPILSLPPSPLFLRTPFDLVATNSPFCGNRALHISVHWPAIVMEWPMGGFVFIIIPSIRYTKILIGELVVEKKWKAKKIENLKRNTPQMCDIRRELMLVLWPFPYDLLWVVISNGISPRFVCSMHRMPFLFLHKVPIRLNKWQKANQFDRPAESAWMCVCCV